MANRFWVGGTANWDNTAGSKWSTTSGGGGGSAVPSTADDVFFDGSSGSGTVTIASSPRPCKSLSFAGFTGTFNVPVSTQVNVEGGIILGSGMSFGAGTGTIQLGNAGGTTSFSITSNGKQFPAGILLSAGIGSGTATITLVDAFSSLGRFDISPASGSFSTGNFNITADNIHATGGTFNFGSSTITLTGTSGTLIDLSGSTISSNTATITTTGSLSGATIGGGTTSTPLNLNITSGSGTVTLSGNFKNVDFTGFTGAWGGTTNIYGNLLCSSGMTSTGGNTITFAGTSGTQTINTNGVVIDRGITFDGVGGTFQLTANFAMASASVRTMTLTNGTFDANNYNVTVGKFASSNSNTRTLTMGSGTFELNGTATVWNLATVTGLTLNENTSTIKLTNTAASTVTFAGGGETYYNLWFDRGGSTQTITISGSNTFRQIKDTGTAAHSQLYTAGTTQTLTGTTPFVATGSSGNAITINSTTTATHSLTVSGGGIVSCDWLNIQHSVASPGTTWYAGANSVDNQAVATAGSGWIFTVPPAAGPANLKSYNGNLKANIKSIDGNLLANIKSLSGNA